MNGKNPHTVLAADIGSTRTHLAAVDTRELSCAGNAVFDNTEFDGRFIPSIKSIVSANRSIRVVNISSCVKRLADRAGALCEAEGLFDGIRTVKPQGDRILLKRYAIKNQILPFEYDNNNQSILSRYGINNQSLPSGYDINNQSLPLQYDTGIQSLLIRYDNPQSLGTDRLCNAMACAALYPGEDCVLIDAGTAITVDFLSGGKIFEGGAILPGLSAQLKALHSQTDKLPLVNLAGNTAQPAAIPAASTTDCIMAGVLYGTAGAIKRITDEYKQISGGSPRAIITGGDSLSIINLVDCDIIINPNLTLIGVGIYEN